MVLHPSTSLPPPGGCWDWQLLQKTPIPQPLPSEDPGIWTFPRELGVLSSWNLTFLFMFPFLRIKQTECSCKVKVMVRLGAVTSGCVLQGTTICHHASVFLCGWADELLSHNLTFSHLKNQKEVHHLFLHKNSQPFVSSPGKDALTEQTKYL